MTDNKNNDSDIDNFFKEFDKISDKDIKKKSKKPKGSGDAATGKPSDNYYNESKVVANRSERLSKQKKEKRSILSRDKSSYKKSAEYPDSSTYKEKEPIKSVYKEKNPAERKIDKNEPEEALTDVNDLFNDSEVDNSLEKSRTRVAKIPESNQSKGKPTGAGKINTNVKKINADNADNVVSEQKKKKRQSNNRTLKKKEPKKKSRKMVWIKRIFAACMVMMVAGIIMVAFILQDTQKIKWNNIYDYLSEASIIYDSDGKPIENIYSGAGNRVLADYEDMPSTLTNAFVAIEDKTFRKHHGFNFIRMGGAVLESLKGDGKIGGTSTITQQLARNLWLTETKSERSLTRKIKEAYYAIQLERHLSKEDILEAYLNTIALGQNTLGVQSASQTYFSKDVQDLTLLECAALASLPQAPGKYSYITTKATDEVSKDDSKIIKEGSVNTYLYNDIAEGRIQTVLDLMEEQGYISSKKHDKTKVKKLRKKIKPNIPEQTNEAQFFVDYTIKAITKDLMKEYNRTEQEANQMVYSGGLKIYTTLDRKMQNAVEEKFKENGNFPNVTNLDTDSNGNLLNDNGNLMLYKYSNYFNDSGKFVLKKNEFKKKGNGDILLKKGKRLNFYKTTSSMGPDINIEFKSLYIQEDGVFYSIAGGVINVPAKYKTLDSNENLIIDSEFIKAMQTREEYKNFMKVKKSKIVIPNSSYSLRQKVQQPQASMVILDHKNGQIKAMVGGRNIEGKMNFNRSTGTRQPGSSIKPIGVYAPALESGAQKKKIKDGESSFGTYWTAGSVIKDEEMKFQGKVWPRNWYTGYRGNYTLRRAVEQSVNTTAVKVFNNIGSKTSVRFLKKLGITTIDSEDRRPAALALGGMTKGISPLQMASAYGTFANRGTHVDTTTYTEIRTKDDALVLKSEPETTKAMDEGAAFIMNDILRTTVTNGIASRASMNNQPVAGKTGTTTDNYDAWFVGNTPQYSASLWIGNDVNIELSEGSKAAASLWSSIMDAATEDDKEKKFPEAPSNVEKQGNEYYIKGTER